MELVQLTNTNNVKVAKQAVSVLQRGGVVLYPTDTVYGLGADATNPEAVEKVRAIKGREDGKPILALMRDLAMARVYVEITPLAEQLAEHFLPGALSLLLNTQDEYLATALDSTQGIRVPENVFCAELMQLSEKPVTSTSANLSGEPTLATVEQILAQLGTQGELIDLVIDAGPLPGGVPSTLVDARTLPLAVIREGAIPTTQLLRALED